MDEMLGAALPVPVPLEKLTLPPELDGRMGSNRSYRGSAQIRAQTDLDAVSAWLSRFNHKAHTFSSYRKEAERLLLWAIVERGLPLSSLSHEDLVAYQQFLKDPQPATRWVLSGGHKYPRQSPHWRPFAGPLSASSLRQSMVILNGLFAWLVDAGYSQGNPFTLSAPKRAPSPPGLTRYLDDELWAAIKSSIEELPQTTGREQAHYSRVRWLFSLLYSTGMRISEVVENSMGGFFYRNDQQGQALWWLEITGKGSKVRYIPVTDELMSELARYRRSLGLSDMPNSMESTPLLCAVGQKRTPLTRSSAHIIVKELFRRAADKFPPDSAAAARLPQASAHWLRHTAGSHMANSDMDLRHVRDNLGHVSLNTTSRYLHSEDDVRHQETNQKHRIDWGFNKPKE